MCVIVWVCVYVDLLLSLMLILLLFVSALGWIRLNMEMDIDMGIRLGNNWY